MATIYDIAKLAGVSPPSVSKALNGSREIGEATRDRVRRIAKELGYAPNAYAKALTNRRSFLVGLVQGGKGAALGLSPSPSRGIIEAFKDRMEISAYELAFIMRDIGGTRMSYAEHCRYRGVDAVFLADPPAEDPGIFELLGSGIACVTSAKVFPGTRAVLSDDATAMKALVLRLAELGHSRIALVTGPRDPCAPAAAERLRGYSAGLAEAGIAYEDALVDERKAWNFEEGAEGIRAILDAGLKPTAVIGGTDLMAYGIMRVLRERGLSVPEGVSVAGFDDYEASAYFQPSLTSVRPDREALGLRAAEILIGALEGMKTGDGITKIPARLMERESTGRAPREG